MAESNVQLSVNDCRLYMKQMDSYSTNGVRRLELNPMYRETGFTSRAPLFVIS
jgi:hypothetical protein